MRKLKNKPYRVVFYDTSKTNEHNQVPLQTVTVRAVTTLSARFRVANVSESRFIVKAYKHYTSAAKMFNEIHRTTTRERWFDLTTRKVVWRSVQPQTPAPFARPTLEEFRLPAFAQQYLQEFEPVERGFFDPKKLEAAFADAPPGTRIAADMLACDDEDEVQIEAPILQTPDGKQHVEQKSGGCFTFDPESGMTMLSGFKAPANARPLTPDPKIVESAVSALEQKTEAEANFYVHTEKCPVCTETPSTRSYPNSLFDGMTFQDKCIVAAVAGVAAAFTIWAVAFMLFGK